MSRTTMSPSSLEAAHRAQEAPTLPPPMMLIFARRMRVRSPKGESSAGRKGRHDSESPAAGNRTRPRRRHLSQSNAKMEPARTDVDGAGHTLYVRLYAPIQVA